jgi:hypothetical protein
MAPAANGGKFSYRGQIATDAPNRKDPARGGASWSIMEIGHREKLASHRAIAGFQPRLRPIAVSECGPLRHAAAQKLGRDIWAAPRYIAATGRARLVS